MADFSETLQRMLAENQNLVTGIPNLEERFAKAKRGFRLGGERRAATDIFELNRRGLGRSVGAATTRGRRAGQAGQMSSDFLLELLTSDATLKGSQKLQLARLLAPMAFEESNRPSMFQRLLGGGLNFAAQIAVPGIGRKLFGNPLMELLSASRSSPGKVSGFDPDRTNRALQNLDLSLGG